MRSNRRIGGVWSLPGLKSKLKRKFALTRGERGEPGELLVKSNSLRPICTFLLGDSESGLNTISLMFDKDPKFVLVVTFS